MRTGWLIVAKQSAARDNPLPLHPTLREETTQLEHFLKHIPDLHNMVTDKAERVSESAFLRGGVQQAKTLRVSAVEPGDAYGRHSFLSEL